MHILQLDQFKKGHCPLCHPYKNNLNVYTSEQSKNITISKSEGVDMCSPPPPSIIPRGCDPTNPPPPLSRLCSGSQPPINCISVSYVKSLNYGNTLV